MRTISSTLLAHKQQAQTHTAYCWRVQPRNGAVEGYTSLDIDLAIPELARLPIGATLGATQLKCPPLPVMLSNGTTLHFNSGGTATVNQNVQAGASLIPVNALAAVLPRGDAAPLPGDPIVYRSQSGLLPSGLPAAIGLSVDPIDITTLLSNTALGIQGVTIEALFSGYYESALVTVFEVDYLGDLTDQVILTSGKLGKADKNEGAVIFELVTWSSMLNRPMGRTVQGFCDVPLFGRGRCHNDSSLGGKGDGPDMTDGTHYDDCTVVSMPEPAVMEISGSSRASDFYYNGRCLFCDGANAGKIIRVIAYRSSSHQVTLEETPPALPQPGDRVRLEEGCGRSVIDCAAKNNVLNFQGFPYVPGQEGAIKQYES